MAPDYFSDLILSLEFPHGKTLPIPGDRAFASASPKLWNSLPREVASIQGLPVFKSNINTPF